MSTQKSKSLVEYLLEKEEIILPAAIFKTEIVEGLERALSTGRPIIFHHFYKRVSEGLPKSVEIQKLGEIFRVMQKFRDEYGSHLTKDDEKIIEFLVSSAVLPAEDFMELLGPIYYLLNAMESLSKENTHSKSLQMFILTSAYVQLYEILLYQIDRRLYYYLNGIDWKNDKVFRKFIGLRREGTGHAMASQINRVLSKLLNMNERNNSLFGKGTPKIIRNSISHANLFYDDIRNVVYVGKKEFTVEQFIREYHRMMAFALRWLELSAGVREGEDVFDMVLFKIGRTLKELSKVFLRIERSEYRKVFGAMVIRLSFLSEYISKTSTNILS